MIPFNCCFIVLESKEHIPTVLQIQSVITIIIQLPIEKLRAAIDSKAAPTPLQ